MLLKLLMAAMLAPPPIVTDGATADWGVPVQDDPHLHGCADADALHLRLDLPPGRVNLQKLDAPAVILLDLDDDRSTGGRHMSLPGADLEVLLSPGTGDRAGGIKVRLPGRAEGTLTGDVVHFLCSPTTAARQFEMRLPRRIVTDAGDIAVASNVPWAITGSLGEARGRLDAPPVRPVPSVAVAAVPSTAAGAVRVVSWNVEFGGLLHRPAPSGRVLAALNPDVLLLQELEPDQTAKSITAAIERAVSGDWRVDLGPTDGRLRSAVATRLPAQDVPDFDALRRLDLPDRTVKAAGLIVRLSDEYEALMVSVHLRCCGGADGPEDMARIGEVLATRRAVDAAHGAHPFDGLVIGGDLNLVGAYTPLTVLVHDGEATLGGTGALAVVDAPRPDGRDLQTWSRQGSAYTPGRLDWIVYSGSSLQALRAFVLDTAQLAPDALRQAGLQAADTADAADHLPVVVDLRPAG